MQTVCEMINTGTEKYRKKVTLGRLCSVFVNWLVFPATVCSLVLGGVFGFQDINKQAADFGDGSIKSKALPADAPAQVIYIPEYENEYEPDGYYEKLHTGQASDIYEFDYSLVPDGYRGIIPISLYKPVENGVMRFSNSSGYDIDYLQYAEMKLPVEHEKVNDYQVLIIHTHSTEAYTEEGVFYDSIENPTYTRSDDKSENMTAIGDIFEETFEQAGIPTLHCEVAIDKASYYKSYNNAAKLIKGYLAEYPEIKYVFDIHRDAVELSSGEKAKVVTQINGQTAAQIMFVVGSDVLVKENTGWKNNLALAIQLQLELNERYEGLARPINIKQGSFNQQYAPQSLLIEVGCDGNTQAEAEFSARLLAGVIAEKLIGNKN